ncbi:Gfo/Idh/MocA family oxidoreductase, partial [bacterium]|nr:Gfo/Idh/MocA family oxidoreductase [bacterium]
GVVSDYGHIPAIHRSPHAKLVAFADPDKERRERQAKKYGLPCFASFDEMVKAVTLDAVSIPTQPAIKLDMIRIAAANGLHAFCEKPLTDTVEQADELVRLMDAAGLFVGVAFVYRGKSTVQRMMELIREGAIGRLRAIHIENMWDYHGLRDQAERGDRRHRALQNLGTLDCGVHDLDLARYMTDGDFASVHAVGTIIEKANSYPDHIIMHARMNNGVLVSIEESAVWGYTARERPVYHQGYHAVGDNGILSTSSGDWAAELHKSTLRVISGEKQWTESLSAEKAWDDTYNQFFQIILGQPVAHRFIADGHDALINMRIAREIVAQCGESGAQAQA